MPIYSPTTDIDAEMAESASNSAYVHAGPHGRGPPRIIKSPGAVAVSHALRSDVYDLSRVPTVATRGSAEWTVQ